MEAEAGIYKTVENPAGSSNGDEHVRSARSVSAVTWARVLGILVVALSISVVILSVNLFRKDTQSLKTTTTSWAPLPPSSETLTTIFFGSCAKQKLSQPYFDTVVKLHPDLLLLLGDNVYGDCTDANCTELRQAYSDWASIPSFQGAKSVVPIVATLDDHDYGQGDCHSHNPHKYVAKDLFVDFFDIPASRIHPHDGVYGSYEWGPKGQRVQLLVLDTRFARSPFMPTDSPMAPGKEVYMPDTVNLDKQMLSPAQWSWLKEELQRPADVRLVVSSIQVLAEGNGFEGWRMLPHEQARFIEMFENETTFILSGDRHVGGFYQYQNLVEVTASSWTHTIPFGAYTNCTNAQECDEVDELRIGDFVRVNHFGSIEFDWKNRSLTLSLRRAQDSPGASYTNRRHDGDAGKVLQSHTYSIP